MIPWYALLCIAYVVALTAITVRSSAIEIGFVIAWYRVVAFAGYWYLAMLALIFVASWFASECDGCLVGCHPVRAS